MNNFEINLKAALDGKYYTPEETSAFLQAVGKLPTVAGKDLEVINAPACLDLETTSFLYAVGRTKKGDIVTEKAGCMYVWMFGINGAVMLGRTWDEYRAFCDEIAVHFRLSAARQLIIYVHNLAFDFQFFRKMHKWGDFFARKQREPLKIVTCKGLQFRCSYMLTGESCAKVGEHLKRYKVQKMVGDLDYRLIRHHGTPLTGKEIQYCTHDVLVIMAHIKECIEDEESILKVPLTHTGYARRFCRQKCLYPVDKNGKFDNNAAQKYQNLMKLLTITPAEYEKAKEAFQGGYTHANAFNSRIIHEKVASFDKTSQYPYQMIAEKYPMSSGRYIRGKSIPDEETFWKLINDGLSIIDIEFTDIDATFTHDFYLSVSRCKIEGEHVESNGRLVKCKGTVRTVLTSIDLDIIKRTYKFAKLRCFSIYYYTADYLPKPYIMATLELYGKKTSLKGVSGMEEEYANAKALLNSLYGMMCTDICNPDIYYDENGETPWTKLDPSLTEDEAKQKLYATTEENINRYNNDKNRFISYLWGVFVTAHARHDLWTGILECKEDYIYSDTDSIKILNADKHADYIENYNKIVNGKVHDMCVHYGINEELTRPKTVKGKEKPIGVWDYEGTYDYFKTLGAKRYVTYSKEDGLVITIAGVNKKKGAEYLCHSAKQKITRGEHNEIYIKDPVAVLELFDENLLFPAEYTDENGEEKSGTGKLTMTYIDEPYTGKLTDYLGNTVDINSPSSIYSENASYNLTFSPELQAFFQLIDTGAIEQGYTA